MNSQNSSMYGQQMASTPGQLPTVGLPPIANSYMTPQNALPSTNYSYMPQTRQASWSNRTDGMSPTTNSPAANMALMNAAQAGSNQAILDTYRDASVEQKRLSSGRNSPGGTWYNGQSDMRSPGGTLRSPGGTAYKPLPPMAYSSSPVNVNGRLWQNGMSTGSMSPGGTYRPNSPTNSFWQNGVYTGGQSPGGGIYRPDPNLRPGSPTSMSSPGGRTYNQRSPRGGYYESRSPNGTYMNRYNPQNTKSPQNYPMSPRGTSYSYRSPNSGTYWSGPPTMTDRRQWTGGLPQVSVNNSNYAMPQTQYQFNGSSRLPANLTQ